MAALHVHDFQLGLLNVVILLIQVDVVLDLLVLVFHLEQALGHPGQVLVEFRG